MKLEQQFATFLTDTVNLNPTRVTLLEDSIEAIKGAVRGFGWGPKIRGFTGQGSWAHKTITKPVSGAPFDADLLVYVDPKEGWDAKRYLDDLYIEFKEHGTYVDKVRRFSHCVTIEYAGERKIDVAPCVVNRGGFIRVEVCNRMTNQFEVSAPKAYTDWIIERNTWSGTNTFRKVTRLLKYLRDVKGTFTCSSVLFTTLIGQRFSSADKDSVGLANVPTALKTVIGRLDNWLQANPIRPEVRNPILCTEVISGAWDDAKYTNFRDKIHTYRGWIDDAYGEADRAESIGKWRRVFGEDFAKAVILEDASQVSERAVTFAKSMVTGSTDLTGDLIDMVKRFGARALPAGFDRLGHMQRPTWKALSQPTFGVIVSATLHSEKNAPRLWDVPSLSPAPKHHWLRFSPATQNGMPLGGDYDVQWRVTNTDREASTARCLRGSFVKANEGNSRWENLSYRGVHMVEAFVIRRRDNVLVAQSVPFYVAIE